MSAEGASGLREAVEALADEWESTVYTLPPGYPVTVNGFCRIWFKAPLRALLAAHPPEPEASADLRVTLADALHDALDGDFLVSAGMRHGNTGVDVAISKAAPKEVVHWAANVCAQVIAATYLPAVVREAEARAWDEGRDALSRDAANYCSRSGLSCLAGWSLDNPYRTEDQ